ncbi:SH3 domain-containing protein [Roseovarius sp.]|uniref:SH3 domain-containing protein n=1 Tax=Roseovarius sp. TaxID=1486281 RepID=UPI003564D6D7
MHLATAFVLLYLSALVYESMVDISPSAAPTTAGIALTDFNFMLLISMAVLCALAATWAPSATIGAVSLVLGAIGTSYMAASIIGFTFGRSGVIDFVAQMVHWPLTVLHDLTGAFPLASGLSLPGHSYAVIVAVCFVLPVALLWHIKVRQSALRESLGILHALAPTVTPKTRARKAAPSDRPGNASQVASPWEVRLKAGSAGSTASPAPPASPAGARAPLRRIAITSFVAAAVFLPASGSIVAGLTPGTDRQMAERAIERKTAQGAVLSRWMTERFSATDGQMDKAEIRTAEVREALSGEGRSTHAVTAYVLNVRAGPSTRERVRYQRRLGDAVRILGRSDGWARIGPDAWVSADYLAPKADVFKAAFPAKINSGSAAVVRLLALGDDQVRAYVTALGGEGEARVILMSGSASERSLTRLTALDGSSAGAAGLSVEGCARHMRRGIDSFCMPSARLVLPGSNANLRSAESDRQ